MGPAARRPPPGPGQGLIDIRKGPFSLFYETMEGLRDDKRVVPLRVEAIGCRLIRAPATELILIVITNSNVRVQARQRGAPFPPFREWRFSSVQQRVRWVPRGGGSGRLP